MSAEVDRFAADVKSNSELQEAEFASEASGYTATKHQREVGAVGPLGEPEGEDHGKHYEAGHEGHAEVRTGLLHRAHEIVEICLVAGIGRVVGEVAVDVAVQWHHLAAQLLEVADLLGGAGFGRRGGAEGALVIGYQPLFADQGSLLGRSHELLE